MIRTLTLTIITTLLALGWLTSPVASQATYTMLGGAESTASGPAFGFQWFFPANITLAVGDTLTITNKLDRAAVYLISRAPLTNVALLNPSSTQLSNATVASSSPTAAYNSSGIIQSGQTFSFKVVSAGTYYIKDIASPSMDMNATVIVTPTAAAVRPSPGDISTAANATIALLSTQAASQLPMGLPNNLVTAGFTRKINFTSAELGGFYPLNVTTSPSGGLMVAVGSTAPVQAIVVSPRRLTFTPTSYVIKCPTSNSSCLNDTLFNATTTPTAGSIFSTGLIQGPTNFTAPSATVLLGTALTSDSTVWVYYVQFYASYELAVKLSADNSTPPTTTEPPTQGGSPPTAIPSAGSTPPPSSSGVSVMPLLLAVAVLAVAVVFI